MNRFGIHQKELIQLNEQIRLLMLANLPCDFYNIMSPTMNEHITFLDEQGCVHARLQTHLHTYTHTLTHKHSLFVCWLLYVPATSECISGTALHIQVFVRPHWDRSCRSNYLTQSQCTETGPTSPSADPITHGAWQGSHWSASFEVTGIPQSGKIPHSENGNWTRVFFPWSWHGFQLHSPQNSFG